MSKSRRLWPALAIAATASLLLAASASAQTAGGVVTSGVLGTSNTDAVTSYWTPERMANAKPVTPGVSGAPSQSPGAGTDGAPANVPPALGGEPASGSAIAPAAAAQAVAKPYTDLPDRLNGKVFFTKAAGGDYVCSGTIVNAENKSIVWTAGHCVAEGGQNVFHRRWIFVPAYSSGENGTTPYGVYSARELWTLTAWARTATLRQDLGAVVVNRINNVRIVDRLGGQGIKFNSPRTQTYLAFGYPQASPFNGFLQWVCGSGLVNSELPPGVGPATMRLSCNLTGGASGGGWLTGITRGNGSVTSVNSYKHTNDANSMYGPYLGNEALSLFNAVRTRPA
jgi:hypothetical protein